MANPLYIKYIHGSADSSDVDVHYVFDELPPLNECKQFCSADPNENRNIIVIKNGEVVQCYKGTVDEVNNATFRTYPLHEQSAPLLITHNVQRDVNLKAIRAVRIILSHLSRSQYRDVVKVALKAQDWPLRLGILKSIDFTMIDFDSLNKNMTGSDIGKTIAFQMGQTIALMGGKELYTKSDVGYTFPTLMPFLKREGFNKIALEVWKNNFVEQLEKLDMSRYDIMAEKKNHEE